MSSVKHRRRCAWRPLGLTCLCVVKSCFVYDFFFDYYYLKCKDHIFLPPWWCLRLKVPGGVFCVGFLVRGILFSSQTNSPVWASTLNFFPLDGSQSKPVDLHRKLTKIFWKLIFDSVFLLIDRRDRFPGWSHWELCINAVFSPPVFSPSFHHVEASSERVEHDTRSLLKATWGSFPSPQLFDYNFPHNILPSRDTYEWWSNRSHHADSIFFLKRKYSVVNTFLKVIVSRKR